MRNIDKIICQIVWNELPFVLNFAVQYYKDYRFLEFLYMSNPNIELTARELEVLELLSRGFSSKEISEQLYISANTVEYHRKQLLRKTSSRNAAELIGNAFRMRLLELDA